MTTHLGEKLQPAEIIRECTDNLDDIEKELEGALKKLQAERKKLKWCLQR